MGVHVPLQFFFDNGSNVSDARVDDSIPLIRLVFRAITIAIRH